MTPIYTLKVQADFSAAHILHGYDGPCSRLHGHNWKVEVHVETTELDNIGMGMDFRALKREVREIVNTLDHQHLNDLDPWKAQNPTAENIASWLYHTLEQKINSALSTLVSLTLWENDQCAVTYSLRQ